MPVVIDATHRRSRPLERLEVSVERVSAFRDDHRAFRSPAVSGNTPVSNPPDGSILLV
jgi:hypothetical protein